MNTKLKYDTNTMPAYLCHVVSFSCLHFELPASLFPLVDPRKC